MNDFRLMLLSFYPVMSFVAFVGLALLGIRIKAKIAILAGVTAGTLDFLARLALKPLNLPPVFDIPLMVLILVLVLRFFTKEKWAVVTGGSILSYILLYAGDFILLPYAMKILNMGFDEITKNIWALVFIGHFDALFVYIFTLLTGLFKFKIIDLSHK